MHNVKNRRSNLKAFLAPDTAGGGPFRIGMREPNIADVCLIPLIHDMREYGIDSCSYPTLTGIELACEDHPWFRGTATESIERVGETLEAPFTRKDLPMSKEGTMDFDPKRSNRMVEESKLRELVTSHHCHYYLQFLTRIRLNHILSVLNTLLYFFELVLIISIVFVTFVIIIVIVVVVVVAVFIISLIFVIISVIVVIIVTFISVAAEKGKNNRNNKVNLP